jgi:hypothetical protein
MTVIAGIFGFGKASLNLYFQSCYRVSSYRRQGLVWLYHWFPSRIELVLFMVGKAYFACHALPAGSWKTLVDFIALHKSPIGGFSRTHSDDTLYNLPTTCQILAAANGPCFEYLSPVLGGQSQCRYWPRNQEDTMITSNLVKKPAGFMLGRIRTWLGKGLVRFDRPFQLYGYYRRKTMMLRNPLMQKVVKAFSCAGSSCGGREIWNVCMLCWLSQP